MNRILIVEDDTMIAEKVQTHLMQRKQEEYAARLFEVEQYADMLLQYLRMESESRESM